MIELSVEDLHLDYGDNPVLKGVSMQLRQGEVVSLLGPSGSGKTTLLRAVAGLEGPKRGRITIGENVVYDGAARAEIPAEERNLGLVFQSYALWPHKTVFENVAYPLKLRKTPGAEVRERVQAVLDQLGLGKLGQRHPHALSGGQQQRVAIGRALVYSPPVILLDEPLSNLDAKLREEMQFELRQIQRKVGTTTIMVTHDQTEAMSISDRVVVMEAGRVTQIDQPHRLYEHPQTRFISNFVGKANLLEGRVTAAGPWATVEVGGRVQLELEAPGVSEGDAVVLSLRPEKIRLVPEAQGRLGGTVKERFFLGSQWLYQVSTAAGLLAVVCPNDGTAPAEEGGNVGLDWAAQQVRLLPGAQGVPA